MHMLTIPRSLHSRFVAMVFAYLAACSGMVRADDFVNKVDAWTKACDGTVCTLTLYKDMKEAKGESDYFGLGLRVFQDTGKPDYFVFSIPPQAQSSQIILSFQDIEREPTKLVAKEITSFLMGPCPSRKDCKVSFPNAVVTPNFKGSFEPKNVWEALHVRQLLLIMMVAQIDGARVERSALISLPAFRHVAAELKAKQ